MPVKYRDTYLEDEKTISDAGTETIDLDLADPITELYIEMEATNGATSNIANPIARNISKIEIVDGSEVLFSLSGQQAIASAAFDLGYFPNRDISGVGGETQRDSFPIRFGRYLGDRELAFDPKRFTNPQLKITWDLATVNALGATGYTSGSGKLTVVARVMEGLSPAPGRFLMTKEHYSWTTAASGDERIDLPTDYPYRRLMVRSYEAGIALSAALTKLKLSVDQDKYVPFSLNAEELTRFMQEAYGRFEIALREYAADGGTVELWLDESLRGLIAAAAADVISAVTGWSAARASTVEMVDSGGIAVANANNNFWASGLCPESTYAIPFGKQDDIADWFQAQEYGSIRLFATQGNAGGAASVFIQQLRT